MALTHSQQVSMLLLKSLRAADDLKALGYVVGLLELEARPPLIERLTGFPLKTIRALHGREVVKHQQGRYPRALGNIIDLPIQHLEVSIFLTAFRLEHLAEATAAGTDMKTQPISAASFITAYREYKRVLRSGELFPPETMLWLADEFVQGRLTLERCRVDDTRYIRSAEMTKLRWTLGRGDCPLCRALATKSSTRRTLKSFEIERARANFEREARRVSAKQKDAPGTSTRSDTDVG